MPWDIRRGVVMVAATWLFALTLFAQSPGVNVSAQPPIASVRVLILSGAGPHDWQAAAPFFRRVLTDTGRFDVRICESPAGLTPKTLADFDVLVDDYAGPTLGADTEKAIAHFVEGGKGLVVTQGAMGYFAGKQAAGSDLAALVKVSLPTSSASDLRTPVAFFDVKLAKPEHPIVKGMKGGFAVADALYRDVTNLPGGEVIATAVERATKGRDDQPVLSVSSHGKGRVVGMMLGHDLAAMQEGGFITTFARGAEWAATGNVTLPASIGLPRPNADAVRALVITGGHDHETSFYSLFDGYKDLAWLPVASSSGAFQSDLRGRYDVLIMYDFTRDLDEKGKKNLRDFVESGKGVVVLHHAILSYQKWPWWYQEVVGGRYRLEPEGNTPTSSALEGQELFVTPQGQHPITAGISPFHILDETYKRMWISPQVQPLLRTDNPNSDPTPAWISPYAKSRVVYIQLGHGHEAFAHPSYRALVHNAVLWAAARLK